MLWVDNGREVIQVTDDRSVSVRIVDDEPAEVEETFEVSAEVVALNDEHDATSAAFWEMFYSGEHDAK